MITLTIMVLVLALYLYNWLVQKRPKIQAIADTAVVLLFSPLILWKIVTHILKLTYRRADEYVDKLQKDIAARAKIVKS